MNKYLGKSWCLCLGKRRGFLFIALCLLTTLLSGCKTDSESDIFTPDEGETTSGKVVINEICGKQDPDDDWLELYNPSKDEADLSGAHIVKTDEEGKDEVIFTFAKGKTIKPGEYVVVATLTGELQAGISNSKEVGLRLVAANGEVMDKFDRDKNVGEGKSHAVGGSYARVPDGTGAWTVAGKATRGGANGDSSAIGGGSDGGKLVINEVCGKQDPDDDWLELYNNSQADKDLSGAKIVKTDEDGNDEVIFTFANGKTIKPGEYVVVATLTGELQAGISNKKQVALTLVAADGMVIDKFDRNKDVGDGVQHEAGGSYARVPNGTGAWKIVAKATRGQENN